MGIAPPAAPVFDEQWSWTGAGDATLRISDPHSANDGHSTKTLERNADGYSPAGLNLVINFTQGKYSVGCDASSSSITVTGHPKPVTVKPVPIDMLQVANGLPAGRVSQNIPQHIRLDLRDQPLPAQGLELSGFISKPVTHVFQRVIGSEVLR